MAFFSNLTETISSAFSTTEVLGKGGGRRGRNSGHFRYPNNLDTNEQPHSVNFFISEYVPTKDTQELKNIQNQNVATDREIGAPSVRTGSSITAENALSVNELNRFGANFSAAFAGLLAARQVNSGFQGLDVAKDLAATVASAGAVDKFIVADATSIKTAAAKRITDTISLHIAQSPQAKYSAEYENESIGALLGTLATTEGGGKVLEGLMTNAANGNAQELIARGLVDAATLPKELGLGNANFGGLARAASKKVRNPFQEQIFKTMNFRSFAFQYKFAPRNQKEFDSVISIINLFKFHMHPEKANDGAFFVFPSTFDIEYRYKAKANAFVNKIATSVLTDMTVDYGSEGVFTTFRGTEGAPSEITMSLVFREIALLTKGQDGQLTDGSRSGF